MIIKEIRAIPMLLNGVNPRELGIRHLYINRLSSSLHEKERWLNCTVDLVTFLNDLNIEYVLIKFLDIPYAYLQDIDLLIENEKDRRALFLALRNRGFSAFRSLFPPHPEKVTFIKHVECNQVQVDIYPEPAWWKNSYAPVGLITSKKIERKIFGTKVYLPPPTYDFYIIVTHSYTHGIITLGELAYATKLVLDYHIEWSELLSLARYYKFEHAIYVYLFFIDKVLKNYSTTANKSSKIKEILHKVPESMLTHKLKDFITIKLKGIDEYFPIIMPKSLRFLSGLHEMFLGLSHKSKFSFRELSTLWLMILENYFSRHRKVCVLNTK